MRYNGYDLRQIISVYKYEGLSPSIRTTMWSPTIGNGDRISVARQPNKTVRVSCVIETDDAGTSADKIEALYKIFTAGKDYVPITFEEVDEKLYMGRVTSVQQTAYYWTVAEYTITLTCLPFRYGQFKTFPAEDNVITGDNTGTAPSLGQVAFTVSNDPDSITMQIQGAGAVQLMKPSDDDLDGEWVIDLEKRTVYRDGDLAMGVVAFENTSFETAEVPTGVFTISFDSAVTDASYTFQEVFL